MANNSKLFLDVSKDKYKTLVGISSDDENYNKIAFIHDDENHGIGIVTRGRLYVNSLYWINIVDELPEVEEDNTIYLVRE